MVLACRMRTLCTLQRVLGYAARVAFGTALFASVALVWLAVVVLLTSSRDRDDRRSDSSDDDDDEDDDDDMDWGWLNPWCLRFSVILGLCISSCVCTRTAK